MYENYICVILAIARSSGQARLRPKPVTFGGHVFSTYREASVGSPALPGKTEFQWPLL